MNAALMLQYKMDPRQRHLEALTWPSILW